MKHTMCIVFNNKIMFKFLLNICNKQFYNAIKKWNDTHLTEINIQCLIKITRTIKEI